MKKNLKKSVQILLELGLKVRQLRMLKGMTQQTLAALCDFEKSSLSRLETGQVNTTILTLRTIAIALEVPVSALFVEGGM